MHHIVSHQGNEDQNYNMIHFTLTRVVIRKKIFRRKEQNSGQDGGVGRNPLLPRTTKRRRTTNLKSINNQKCQKIKLHGTLQGIKEKINQNNQTGEPRQRYRTQMKEQSKTPERELSNEEIANLYATEFKVLVIKMLTEPVSYTHLTLPTTLVKCRSRWSPYH